MRVESSTKPWADCMAVFWVQQYCTLPVILEHFGMGDELPQRRRPFEGVDPLDARRVGQPSPKDIDPEQQQQLVDASQCPSQSLGMGHAGGASTLNMGHMANVLPGYRSPNYDAHSYQQASPMPSNTPPATIYHYPHNPPFSGQTRPPYDSSFAQQYPDPFLQNQASRVGFPNYAPPSGYQASSVQSQQQFTTQQSYYHQPQQQHASNYSAPYTQPHLAYAGLNTAFNPYSQSYDGRSNPNLLPGQMRPTTNYFFGPSVQTGNESLFVGTVPAGAVYAPPSGSALSRHSSDSSLKTSVPRGPPRKPRQSGHALWVGNLPPGTNVADLKDHFSRHATKDIESVFLISKSNCAFVNYKTEAACADAMTRFHDSRFQGVRLVCRPRRGSGVTPSGAPVNPTSATGSAESQEVRVAPSADGNQQLAEPDQPNDPVGEEDGPPAVATVKEKFFVVKSLTVEDMETSVRNGIWATQAHNEAALNKAYEITEHVYLIFSANKSGEYFGYARMASPIGDDVVAQIEPPAQTGPPVLSLTDLPTTIPTPATEFAPKGRIIDDSARGTIFWEADFDSEEEEQQKPDDSRLERGTESDDPEAASPATPQSFGKPFKIEWVSTERLPFYRTRGLRNPWNSNREVKIARDGTELEPSVGRRLVSMFHKPQLANSSAAGRGQLPPGQIYPPTMAYMQQPPAGRPY